MLRDYVCSLCSARYEYMPPDGCFCTDHKTTVYYDGKESKILEEKRLRERRQQREAEERQRQAEAKKKAQNQPKPKPKPQPKSSSETGPTLGFLTFVVVGLFIYFGMEEHYGVALVVGAIVGIIVRYTYKLIIFIILLIAAYYIYTEYFEKSTTSSSSMTTTSEPKKTPETKPITPITLKTDDIKSIWRKKSIAYNSITAEHNQTINRKPGMIIRVNFDLYAAQYTKCRLNVWFYYSDGEKLHDLNSKYSTTNGQVSVGKSFSPILSTTKYTEFSVFMPYEELHLEEQGKHYLKYRLQVFSDDVAVGQPSDYHYFDISFKD